MADDEGRPTPAGTLVHAYLDASIGKRELFGWPMCQVEISGWPASQLRPEEPVIADGSRLSLSRADPQDARRVPPLVDGGVLVTSTAAPGGAPQPHLAGAAGAQLARQS